jgi:hypothetical protein
VGLDISFGGGVELNIITAPVFITIFWFVIFIPTHLAISVITYRDARNLEWSALGIKPFLWFGIAFSLPILGMFIYWVMNYSTLSKQPS